MGCVGIGANRDIKLPNKMLDSQDVMNRKRQILVEYALRNKIASILELVNLRTPFEIVKELSISNNNKIKRIPKSNKYSISNASLIYKNSIYVIGYQYSTESNIKN